RVDDLEIRRARMTTIHRIKNTIGTGLHRKMQLRHQHRQIAMRSNELVVHVAGMASGVTQACDARNLGDLIKQRAEGRTASVRSLSMIGIDVLTDEYDLANAGVGETFDFGDDFFDWPRDLGTARVGHDAEAAKLITTFLHGDECRHTTAA